MLKKFLITSIIYALTYSYINVNTMKKTIQTKKKMKIL